MSQQLADVQPSLKIRGIVEKLAEGHQLVIWSTESY